MASVYQHRPVEAKWQKRWEETGANRAFDVSLKKKFYGLIEFPYPSAEGLHVGHPRSYTAMDVMCRKKRMEGYNVLFPIGFDAFGLPAENYAMKTGAHPETTTKKNIANYTRQLKSLGYSFDWSRVVETIDPAYYQWTQWIFLQLFKHGLAYKIDSPTNWCTSCQVTLANEEVTNGHCERCSSEVIRKNKEQWMLRITDYAEDLISGLNTVDYLEVIKEQQRNWIGKSEGAKIIFPVQGFNEHIEVFTTRADTLFGATYLVLAPDHPLVDNITTPEQKIPVTAYREAAKHKSDLERTDLAKEKTGVFIGASAINPVTGKEIPLWIADYVLSSYGTGAIMAVPAHDERDFDFAKKYNLPIITVVTSPEELNRDVTHRVLREGAFVDDGMNVNSDFLNGLSTPLAKERMIAWLSKHHLGSRAVGYRLRDWVFSRQRYWGEPMPVVYCQACKDRQQKVLLIHGFAADSNMHWFPWMKRELERIGFEVFAPDLPESAHPDLESWMHVLLPYVQQMGHDDVIIGHSLGSKAALHLLEKADKKIGYLFLVGTAIGEVAERDWNVVQQDFHQQDISALRRFWEIPVDWDKVEKLAWSKNVIVSDDDPLISHKDRGALKPGWYFRLWHGFGHFLVTKVPELFEVIARCKNIGWVTLREEDLPLQLPLIEKYQSSPTGESPLAEIPAWRETVCPRCGGQARRETDTMPQWAGSSWYFLRYCDPQNKEALASWEKLSHWMPVDCYSGGPEHITLHLLYSRFWNQFLFDLWVVPCREPYAKRVLHGLILGEGGGKMSKSKGNVVNPDVYVNEFGADTFRTYMLFFGPFDQAIPWDHQGVIGVRRFLERVWNLQEKITETPLSVLVNRLLHKTIKKVSSDIDSMKFNTAIAALMACVNEMIKLDEIPKTVFEQLLILLSPFAPHLCEELWERLGKKDSVTLQSWPSFDSMLIREDAVEIVIQVNGKVRDRMTVALDAVEADIRMLALEREKVKRWLLQGAPARMIYVQGKLLNIVVE